MVLHKTEQLLRRQTLQESLQTIETIPLMIVIAAIGYGKTCAIHCLKGEQTDARYAYVSIAYETRRVDLIWEHIQKQIQTIHPELAKAIENIPFPKTLDEREKCAEILVSALRKETLVLVLDNYHLIQNELFHTFITFLAQCPNTNLHLLLASRRIPDLPVDELILKGCCTMIMPRAFQFTPEELHHYVLLQGLSLTAEQEQTLMALSEGWITAIKLMIHSYKRTGSLGDDEVIHRLLATSEIPRYTNQQLWLLKQLSHLDEFSAPLASVVAGVPITAYMLEQIEQESSFISYDQVCGTYRLHPLFRKLLNNVYTRERYEGANQNLEESMLDERTILLRAGQWYLACQKPVPGFTYLLKAQAYDTILEEFSKASRNRLLDAEPSFIVSLFSAIPKKVCKHHLYTWLAYIGFYCTNIDIQATEGLLKEFNAALDERRTELTIDAIHAIQGEIALIQAYAKFNNEEQMAKCFHQAYRLLGGRSKIADADKIITFGSPHALFLYHRKKGTLEKTMKTVQQMFPFYSEMAGGCGKGFDDLLSAEFSLERGDLQQAQLFAYRAFYKASSLDQYEVMLSSQFALARIFLALGDIQEVYSIIEIQKEKIPLLQSPILQASFELSVAYLASQLNKQDCIAPWIAQGQLSESPILYHGQGFIFLVYGKYLLLHKSYIQLEVFCERMKEVMSRFTNQLGYLHAYIQEAAAKYQLYDIQSAEIPLIKALEIGFADDLIVPFAEYSYHIMDILFAIR
ncbi:MAG: hypothetical protein EOM15_06535, partial [Spirochaetia bacterium]|nr:hypothetical protein [Spirochaetia bacterium]